MKKILLLLNFTTLLALTAGAQITNVNIGTGPNSGDGDTLRTAFSKLNANISYLAGLIGSGTNGGVTYKFSTNFSVTAVTNIDLGPEVITSLGMPTATWTGTGATGWWITPAIFTDSSSNTFVGQASGAYQNGGSDTPAILGAYNSAFGYGAMQDVDKGSNNVSIGFDSLFNLQPGSQNTAVGNYAGNDSIFNQDEALFGYEAGYTLGNGSAAAASIWENTFVGSQAALNLTKGTNNTAVGFNAGSAWLNGSNNIAIGSPGVVGDSGQIRIGTPGVQTDTTLTGIIHGDGAGLNSVPVATQNLTGIFTNVVFIQTNGPGITYATNGGNLTVFEGVNTNVPNITTNGFSASGQVPISTNVAPYYFWGTLPSGGGGGGTVWQYQSGEVNANITLPAGEAEVPIITGGMSGAVGHGGRLPWNTPMTVTNFSIRFETSPAMTNGQSVYIYFVTNGVEDRSFIVAGQGYGSADTYITSGTATYSYVPQGTNPVISMIISNAVALNNCQYSFSFEHN